MVSLLPSSCITFTALRNMLPFDRKERRRFPLFSYIRFKLWLLRYVFLISYRISDKVIFISNYSLNQVQRHIPDIKYKSKVIYHGVNNMFLEKSSCDFNLPDFLDKGQYFLYVSILDVYKAQKEVVESWIKFNENGNRFPLVLVGPKYNNYGEIVVKLIQESKQDNIFYLGSVDYEKLPALYQNSRALIFASSCECCPNILLEKLASGRPVICSNISPMPEFAKDSVIYFDPYGEGSLEASVNYLERNENLFCKYSKLSIHRASEFSWKATSRMTFEYLLTEK